MKNFILIIISFMMMSAGAFSQKTYFTKSGNIDFFSKASAENIEAVNNQVVSTLKTESGELSFGVLIKSFKFKNALMEEHFNENYMESTKFPKATFKGKITNLSSINFDKKGNYSATISGEMTIHGVTKEMNSTAQLEVKDNTIDASSKIIIKPADYGITIPDLVKDNIAKEISVEIKINYELYSK